MERLPEVVVYPRASPSPRINTSSSVIVAFWPRLDCEIEASSR